jgi:hypothetical protein
VQIAYLVKLFQAARRAGVKRFASLNIDPRHDDVQVDFALGTGVLNDGEHHPIALHTCKRQRGPVVYQGIDLAGGRCLLGCPAVNVAGVPLGKFQTVGQRRHGIGVTAQNVHAAALLALMVMVAQQVIDRPFTAALAVPQTLTVCQTSPPRH